MGGFAPPMTPRQGSDPFFSTMAKRGMARKRPQGQMSGQGPTRQPPQQMPPTGLPPVPAMPPPQPAGPPAGLPPTGGPLMAPPMTGGPLMAPQATGSSADVNLGSGFDQMRASQRRQAGAMYGPGGNPSFIR